MSPFPLQDPRRHPRPLWFTVEHAGTGGINKEGMLPVVQESCTGMQAAGSELNARASGLSSWSSKGLSSFFLQSLSLAIANLKLKGLGHLFMVTAASVPLSSV